MIQELLGMVEGRNINIQEVHLPDGSSSSFNSTPISSPSSSPSPISSSEPQQNLKCPRCDSSNTKFCYYNNYNLTQPRHFCKTCRRYWTKGGALRNVPIGGGCRRGKPSPPLAAFRSGSNKAKPAPPNVTAQDRELPACPVLWASPYSSQLLALLRASQLQNPNPNPLMRIKDDNTLNAYSHLGQIAAGPYQSLWRNVGGEHLNQHQQHYQHNMMSGSSVNEGFLQKMRLSPANCYTEQLPAVMGSASSYSPAPLATAGIGTNSYIMDSLPISGGDFGYWNADFLG